VTEAVQSLHDLHIAHFDLKCDNIFIRDLDAMSETMDESVHSIPFAVCIGDFGEAQIGEGQDGLVRDFNDA
jgi:serine/threonine protein kinase